MYLNLIIHILNLIFTNIDISCNAKIVNATSIIIIVHIHMLLQGKAIYLLSQQYGLSCLCSAVQLLCCSE